MNNFVPHITLSQLPASELLVSIFCFVPSVSFSAADVSVVQEKIEGSGQSSILRIRCALAGGTVENTGELVQSPLHWSTKLQLTNDEISFATCTVENEAQSVLGHYKATTETASSALQKTSILPPEDDVPIRVSNLIEQILQNQGPDGGLFYLKQKQKGC